MKKYFFLGFILLAALYFPGLTYAKQPSLNRIPEIIHFEKRYSVDRNKLKEGIGGYIEGWDMQRNIRLWILKVYDKPTIRITSLSIQEGNLIVENEVNEKY